jgi:hypothetical protein
MSRALQGPYPLEFATVDVVVPRRSVGVYTLSRTPGPQAFAIAFIGRAEGDLNVRLKQHVGSYASFQFTICASPEAAFLAECELFHAHAHVEGQAHPAGSAKNHWKCPWCERVG